MESYKIIQLGNPILRTLSANIQNFEFASLELKNLEALLFKAMKKAMGIGLAAPQIGVNKRAIVFGLDHHPRRPHDAPIPFTALFNPSYLPLSDELVEDYEGCLSVGDLRGKVSRYQSIRYRGYDSKGQLIERDVSDLHARVVQHEIDHLDGIVFLDRITNHASLGFHDELMEAGTFTFHKTD